MFTTRSVFPAGIRFLTPAPSLEETISHLGNGFFDVGGYILRISEQGRSRDLGRPTTGHRPQPAWTMTTKYPLHSGAWG